MTNIFQPLDVAVNGAAKAIMKRKCSEWYSGEITQALDTGKELDDINIPLKLSVLKPFQAKWILELYDYYITSKKGPEVIANVWRAARIAGAVEGHSQNLDNLDPFAALDPLKGSCIMTVMNPGRLDAVLGACFVNDSDDVDDGVVEWHVVGDSIRNIFEIIEDVM